MCVQTVGLVQTAIERAGIPTVSLSLLREVTAILRPPRALVVPFAFGYPLGRPHDAALQHRIIKQALDLLPSQAVPLLTDLVLPAGISNNQ